MKFLKLGVLAVFVGLFVFACADTETAKITPANEANQPATNATPAQPEPTATIDDLAMGKTIYMDSCVKCHKEDGTGGKTEIEGKIIKADNLTTDKMAKMSHEKYVDYIKNGVPDEGMPAFGDQLSDAQIDQVIKYIRTEFQGK